MEPLQQITKGRTVQDMEDAAQTQTVEELNQGLEEIGSDFGTETVQQVNKCFGALIFCHFNSSLRVARPIRLLDFYAIYLI